MGTIRILGGRKLEGSLRIQGSKNAALPMIAASVLHNGKSVLHNCPRIADVKYMAEILKSLGAEVYWQGESLYMNCEHLVYSRISEIYAERMRSSIIFLGALLGAMGKSAIAHPGGCVIGPRPIDMHLKALECLGARVEEREGMIYASCSKLRGADIEFKKKSVGATQQAILAAVKAEGTTRLYNCAREPEIQWLARFLNARGADVRGAGSDEIMIRGVEQLTDIEYEVPPDRIVAGTYMCAAAITRSRITLENVPVEELEAFFKEYRKMGGQYEGNSGKLVADGRKVDKAIPFLETDVYPGFPTDLQSPLMAVLATVHGTSHIRETIFEDRYKAADGLRAMGAGVLVKEKDAWVQGVHLLRGKRLQANELRGGAALVLAGLAAQGETIVENCEYIERGYAHICEDLSSLGAVIDKDTGKNLHEDFELS